MSSSPPGLHSKILSQKKETKQKEKMNSETVNYENILYLTQNLNIQNMLRQETSVHLEDGREIGNKAVFAGQVSQ